MIYPMAPSQQKANLKHASWKGAREKIASADDVAGARTSRIERWRWGQGREDRNGLMRPEITHSLIKITTELAEILGIALDEGK